MATLRVARGDRPSSISARRRVAARWALTGGSRPGPWGIAGYGTAPRVDAPTAPQRAPFSGFCGADAADACGLGLRPGAPARGASRAEEENEEEPHARRGLGRKVGGSPTRGAAGRRLRWRGSLRTLARGRGPGVLGRGGGTSIHHSAPGRERRRAATTTAALRRSSQVLAGLNGGRPPSHLASLHTITATRIGGHLDFWRRTRALRLAPASSLTGKGRVGNPPSTPTRGHALTPPVQPYPE